MSSTRTRLALAFAATIVATLVAFAVALYYARRADAYQQLGQRAHEVATDVLGTIRSAQLAGKRLTFIERSPEFGPVVRSTQELGELLAPRPGFFLVLDSQDKLLFPSAAVQLLSPDAQDALFDVALRLKVGGEAALVPVRLDSLTTTRLLVIAVRDPAVGPNVSRVVAALPSDTADLAPELLLGTMLALLPIALLVAVAVAWLIAGRAFRPVEQLINDVEAITDGRSLHRRLPADHGNDELSRLSATLNAMLARLENSFGALRRFTADASHELKTPLSVMRVDVERAMHPGTTGSDRAVALEEALQETARMADLVDSLLTLARADEGRFDLHREPVRLEPLVRDVYETATILGEDSGITITIPQLDDGTVLGDPFRLRQLFLNLVTNAIKYTPRGGRVEIALTRRPHDEISFAVRDTGIGISANDLPHIFERFWRADRVRSRSTGRSGFGLGLSIAQWIVQAHGGSITAQSRLGRGSIFTVVLPLAETAEIAARGETALVDGAESDGTVASAKAESNIDFTVS